MHRLKFRLFFLLFVCLLLAACSSELSVKEEYFLDQCLDQADARFEMRKAELCMDMEWCKENPNRVCGPDCVLDPETMRRINQTRQEMKDECYNDL